MEKSESLLKFPCSFPIKMMGLNSDDFEALVVAIINKHVLDLPAEAVKTRLSGEGKYLAVTITFIAESREQLDAIYREISAEKRIMMAL
jgi:putative lipoic acid-binding regulatory protein